MPLLLIAVFALSRWPGLMPPNFSAAYAIVFCAGLYLPARLAWTVRPSLAVLAGSDLIISLVFYRQYSFSLSEYLASQCPNYLAYAGLIWLGRVIGGRRPWWTLLGGGILGAILFYLVTNTASWLTLEYPKSFAGWIQALTTGFPQHPPTWEFFRNTLISGGLFTGLFVGAMKATGEKDAEEEEETADKRPAAEPIEAEN